MRPSRLKFAIAASLFVVIVVEFGFWFVSQISEAPQIPIAKAAIEMPSPSAALDPTIYPIPFCELMKSPERYNRKLIRTRAIFDNGEDWSSLKHDDCPAGNGRVGVIGAVEPNDQLIEANSTSRIRSVLDRLISENWEGPFEVDADMVGRFYVQPNGSYQFAILYEFDARATRRQW